MAEGQHANFEVADSRLLIYLPGWAKWVSVIALLALFCVSAASCVYFLRSGQTGGELIVFAISIAQSSAVALVFVIVLFYSRRDANIGTLMVQSDEFLRRHLRDALARISVPQLGIRGFQVHDDGTKDIFGHSFRLESGEFKLRIWVGLNVRRLFVIYFLQHPAEEPGFADRVAKIFQFTFGGAEAVGFKAHYERAVVDGEAILSIWLTTPTEPDLLTSPNEKLFWAQDIAMMTESYIRTALRNDLKIFTRCLPGPL
jgi:hypothetical protein